MDCTEYTHALNVHVHHMIKICNINDPSFFVNMLRVLHAYAVVYTCTLFSKRVGSILLMKIVDLQLLSPNMCTVKGDSRS